MSNTSIRRREFIASASVVTGLACAPNVFAGSQNSLHALQPADFEKMIGQPFQVAGTDANDNPVRGTMVLQEIVANRHASDKDRPATIRPSGFTLRFAGPANLPLAQGTHLVSGGEFPRAGLFLKELTDERTRGQRQFEAVFN